MGSKGGGSTVSQTSSLPPQVAQWYQSALSQDQAVSQIPFQSFDQQLVAGLTPTQQAASQGINNTVGYAQPYMDAATAYTAAGANPIQPQNFSPQAIQQYSNPYTQQVVNSTMGLINQQNAQQRSNLNSDAIKAGNAFGGDRLGVAQAQLAENQALTNNQTIAGLYNQNYNQALGEFNQQQGVNLNAQQANAGLNLQAGSQMANLGTVGQANQLQGLGAALNAGTLDQQTQQNLINAQYGQFLRQIQYPYESSQFLTNAAEGIGSLSGGSSSTTYPQPSTASQVLGGVAGAVGILGQTGAFNSGYSGGAGVGAFGSNIYDAAGGRVPHRAGGGLIPSAASMSSPLVGGGIPGSGGLGAVGGGPPPRSNMSSLGLGSIMGGDKTSTQTGGGQDNTLQTVGQIVSIIAAIASMADGGRVDGADGSDTKSDDPMRKTLAALGIIPSAAVGAGSAVSHALANPPHALGHGPPVAPSSPPDALANSTPSTVDGITKMYQAGKGLGQTVMGKAPGDDSSSNGYASGGLARFAAGGSPAITPEPASDIHAQVQAMLSPANPKDSVFIAKGNEDAVPRDLAQSGGIYAQRRPEGVLLTTNPDKAHQFASAGQLSDSAMAQILGYPGDKAGAIQGVLRGDGAITLQARDAQGNVVQEATVSGAKASDAAQQLGRYVPPGGQIVSLSPIQAHQRRLALREGSSSADHFADGGQPPPPLGSQGAITAALSRIGSHSGTGLPQASSPSGSPPSWGQPNGNGMPVVSSSNGSGGFNQLAQWHPPQSVSVAQLNADQASRSAALAYMSQFPYYYGLSSFLKRGGPVHYAAGGMSASDRSFVSGLAQAYQDQGQSAAPGLDASGDPMGLSVKRNYDMAGASTPMAPTSPEGASKLGLSAWSGFAQGGAPHYDDGGTIFDDITRPSADNMEVLDAISRHKALAAANDNPHEEGLARAVPQRKAAGSDSDWATRAVHSPWSALAQAGFATMAGTSPYAGVNIGRGMLAGEQALQDIPKYDIQRAQAQGLSAEAEGKRLANFGLKKRMEMYGLNADEAGSQGASSSGLGVAGATGLPSQAPAAAMTDIPQTPATGSPTLSHGKAGRQTIALQDPSTGGLLDPATLWRQYNIAQMTGDPQGAAALLHVLESMQPQGAVLSESGLAPRPGYYKFRSGEEAAKSAGNTLGWANLGLDRMKTKADIWGKSLQYDPGQMYGMPSDLQKFVGGNGGGASPVVSGSPSAPAPASSPGAAPQPPAGDKAASGAPGPTSVTGQYWNYQDVVKASAAGLKGEDILKNLRPDTANELRQMLDGRSAPNKGFFPSGVAGQMAVRLANMVDPTWNETVWAARNKQMSDLGTSGTAGKMAGSIRLAVEHSANALKDISDLDNAGLPQINWAQNKGAGAWGDIKTHSEVGDLKQALGGLSEEMRKVFANAQGGALQEYNDWQSRLGDAYESKPYAIEMLRHGMLMLLSRTNGLKQQYDYTMDPDGAHPERHLDLDKLMGPDEQHAITTLMRYPIRTKSGDLYWEKRGLHPEKVYESSVYTPLLHPFRRTPDTSPLMDIYHHLRLEPKVSDEQFLKLGDPIDASPPASALKPGVHTTFANGQVWALDANGNPERIK